MKKNTIIEGNDFVLPKYAYEFDTSLFLNKHYRKNVLVTCSVAIPNFVVHTSTAAISTYLVKEI